MHDASVVGLPDERFGESITALIEPEPGADIDPSELLDHVKARLARFKAPKSVITIDTVGRTVNGKLDYKALNAIAERA